MNDIEKARARINQRVAEYIQSHPDVSYSQIANALEVSRWRVMAVATGIGISRKTGPKTKHAVDSVLDPKGTDRDSTGVFSTRRPNAADDANVDFA